MSPSMNLKEVKQFLGLGGYYCKFIAHFEDTARLLTSLAKKDTTFNWTKKHQEAFQFLKESLMKEPILKYPDPKKPYVLFTDTSKYAWACVLTQFNEHEDDGEKIEILHPITFQKLISW